MISLIRLPSQPYQMAIDDPTEPAEAGIQPANQAPVFLSMNFCISEFEGAWVFLILLFALAEVRFQADVFHGQL